MIDESFDWLVQGSLVCSYIFRFLGHFASSSSFRQSRHDTYVFPVKSVSAEAWHLGNLHIIGVSPFHVKQAHPRPKLMHNTTTPPCLLHDRPSPPPDCVCICVPCCLIQVLACDGDMIALNGRIHEISEPLREPAPDVYSLLSSTPELSGWADWVQLVSFRCVCCVVCCACL